MKKTLHRFIVKATDDAVVDDYRTRWKIIAFYDTRRAAWHRARALLHVGHYRHVQIVEERRYS